MKKKRFSEEQIVRILREAEKKERSIGEICKTHGVSEQSFYRWRNRFGAMAVSDVRRLRQLEKENGRLKRLLAERELEIDAMKEVVGRDF
jgi:putative transposase